MALLFLFLWLLGLNMSFGGRLQVKRAGGRALALARAPLRSHTQSLFGGSGFFIF